MIRPEFAILLQAAVPFAKAMVSEHGALFPVGMALGVEGGDNVTWYGLDEEHREASASAQISVLKRMFRDVGSQIKAAAIAFEVRVGSEGKNDAICVNLQHTDGDGLNLIAPFVVPKDGKVVFGAMYAVRAPNDVFSTGQ